MGAFIITAWIIGMFLLVVIWVIRAVAVTFRRASRVIRATEQGYILPGEPPETWCPRHWPYKCPSEDPTKTAPENITTCKRRVPL